MLEDIKHFFVWSLQHSYREVGILLLYLAVGVSVFSGIAYTAEYEEVTLDRRLAPLAHDEGHTMC